MLLKLYDQTKTFLRIIDVADACAESELANGDKTLTFSYRGKQTDILNEYYVETQTDRYVVKEVRPDIDRTMYTCKLDLEDLEAAIFYRYTAVDKTIAEAAAPILEGTGWTVSVDEDLAEKERSVQQFKKTAYEIIMKIRDAFMCEVRFDTLNKVVYFADDFGEDRGVYLRPELNLKSLNLTIDSYDYVTRLVPIGKDGLTIEEVNDGKEYVENYQYTSKIRTAIWEDTNYEDAETLKEDAEGKLEDLSKPKRSYSVQIRDLARSSPGYSAFAFGLGDTISIVDEPLGVKEKQRIVKMTEYPDDPSDNKAELSNTALTWEEMQDRLQAAADAWDDVSNPDGTVNGVYVHGISDGNKVIIQTEINGNTKVNQAVKAVSVQYALGQSQTTPPVSGWGTAAPENVPNMFLWQRVVKEFNDGAVDTTEVTCVGSPRNGGRNLVLATDKPHTSPAGTGDNNVVAYGYTESNYGHAALHANTDDVFTVAFDYDVSGPLNSNTFLYAQLHASSIARTDGNSSALTITETNRSGRYIAAFRPTQAQIASEGQAMRVLLSHAGNGTTLTISNMMVERGGESSDWSPAPEDAQTVADAAYDRVTSVYGVCSTAGGTASKTVNVANFSLFTGARIAVFFQYANEANSPTLNINNTGAKPIAVSGASSNPVRLTASDKKNWGDNTLVEFTYDGTNWRIGDSTSLTRIDNILTNNIVGTNGWISLAQGTFNYGQGRLVWDGSDLYMSGAVYADAGYIGGWAITDESLKAQSETTASGTNVMWIRDGTATDNQDFIAVEHHSTEPDDPDDVVSWPFWVRADGTFHAEEGNIAGWDFTSAGFAKDGNELFPGGMILANAPSGYKWLIDTNIAQGRGINFACDPNTGQYTGLVAFDEAGGIWANDVVVGKCFDSSRGAGRYVQSAANDHNRVSYIGTDANDVLLVGGQFGGTGYGNRTIVMSSSDERIKKNIMDTSERGLDFLNRIRLVEFDWKDGSGHKSIGIIADELEELNPELVVGGGETIKAIDTLELLAYVIKAVQELSERR